MQEYTISSDPESSPEAAGKTVFCLERSPGKTSEEALLNSLPDAAEDFKSRILAALVTGQVEVRVPRTAAVKS